MLVYHTKGGGVQKILIIRSVMEIMFFKELRKISEVEDEGERKISANSLEVNMSLIQLTTLALT